MSLVYFGVKMNLRYNQVKERLKKEFLSGKSQEGQQLPAEPVLSLRYGVSRVTLRRAIEELCADGCLKKIHGKGTFILGHQKKREFRKIWKIILSNHPLFSQLILTIENFAHQHDFEIVFANNETADLENHIKRGVENQIAGYFLMPHFAGSLKSEDNQKAIKTLMELRLKKVPFILINRNLRKYKFDVVESDGYFGGFLATQHLIEHGYKRIAYLSSSFHPQHYSRLLGYQDALKKSNMNEFIVKDIIHGKNIHNDARELISGEKPRAIVALNDWIASEVFIAAEDLGVKIPEELAVVGYDDMKEPLYSRLSLTTIDMNLFQVAEQAAELLFRRTNGDWTDFPRKIKVRPALIVRQSCGCKISKAMSEERFPKSCV